MGTETQFNLPPSGDIREWMRLNAGVPVMIIDMDCPVKNPYVVPGVRLQTVAKNATAFIGMIEKEACNQYAILHHIFKENNKSRKREFANIRQLVWHLLKKYFPKITYHALGDVYGKDHATAIHGLRAVSNLCETDREFRNMLIKIESKLIFKPL